MSDPVTDLGAVVLAAGLSSRMGAFKPLLEIEGKSMLRRVVSIMEGAGAAPIVVVTGHRREEVEGHLRGSNALLVHNPHFRETQMLDSLLLGLDALEGRCARVLISPADVPLVRPETVRRVLEKEGRFVRPVHQGKHGHPVAMDFALAPLLRQYQGPGGLRGAMEAGGIAITDVPVDDMGVTLDADTEAEYANLLEYHSRL